MFLDRLVEKRDHGTRQSGQEVKRGAVGGTTDARCRYFEEAAGQTAGMLLPGPVAQTVVHYLAFPGTLRR